MDSAEGDFVAAPTHTTDTPEDIGTVDAVIVATKAWQVAEAATVMRPLVGENTVIVPLLNGVEAPAQLAGALGDAHVLGGFCRVLSYIEGPGHVVQGGTPPFVAFGELDNSETERVQQLRALFAEANVTVQDTPDIQAAMWQKLLFIASFSGVGAVTRSPAGTLRDVPQVYAMLQAAMREVEAVARARGINMREDAVPHGLNLINNLPDEATASMQRDVLDGRPSELEAQNGAVVRLGLDVDVPTPTHNFLYASLLPAEMRARAQ